MVKSISKSKYDTTNLTGGYHIDGIEAVKTILVVRYPLKLQTSKKTRLYDNHFECMSSLATFAFLKDPFGKSPRNYFYPPGSIEGNKTFFKFNE